ncbi:MAG: TPM domain-containing protein [Cryobacterium sp.]|nr:TPM domain-containing protein [Oligoflexia bacterium]
MVAAVPFSLAHPAFAAETFVVPKLTGAVVDEANLITPDAKARLESDLTALSDSGAAQLVILTTPSLQGLDIADYGIRIAEAWKIGFKGGEKGKDSNRDRGVILIIAPTERAMRIEVGYGLEGEIPDVVASRILEEVVKPRFRAGEFSEGIVAGATVLRKLASGDGSQAFPPRERRRSRDQGSPWLILIVICFLVSRLPFFSGIPLAGAAGYFLGASMLGGGLLGAVAGLLIAGVLRVLPVGNFISGGGMGGGGFGGFGGGGGGGGFGDGGGGSFGGGGSSSNW